MNIDEGIKKIEEILEQLDCENRPLMKKPTEEDFNKSVYTRGLKLETLSIHIFYGVQMHTESHGADETVWHFPDGVEEQLDDRKKYKVWYTWRDAADPADMSTYYTVYYIEEVTDAKLKLKSAFEKYLTI